MVGCTSQVPDEINRVLTYEEQSLSDFALLLNESENPDTIETYMNEHLETLDQHYIQAMVKAYETYLQSKIEKPENKLHMNHIEYNRLLQYSEYLSPEYVSYLTLYENERETDSLSNEPIDENIDILLKNSALLEVHLLTYPDGDTESDVYELYVRYLYAAMMNNGNPLIIKSHPESIQMMQDFMTLFPQHHTASFVNYYVKLLEDNEYSTESKDLQDFYFNFYSLLRSYLWNNEAPQS
jgi:hypothetical protein